MKEKKEQKTTWKSIGFQDMRSLPDSRRLPEEEIVQTQDTAEMALLVLEHHLGFLAESISEVKVRTPIGEVSIGKQNLTHIVEKRQDARERYVKHAIATMRDPLEVWLVEYEDEGRGAQFRYAYIGAFVGKRQMLVICAEANGKILWNFMHGDNKTLNKHRHGECIYTRA